MEFEQLSTDYIDDYIAEAMLARETEWFHYNVDRQNFEDIRSALPVEEAAQRADMERRIQETTKQMAVVDSVYAALKRRIRSPDAHAAAIERVRLKHATGD